jgi:hypothetical protein
MNPNAHIEPQEDVEDHLMRLRETLRDENCELDILPLKKGQSDTDRYSTLYTMNELEYDSEDIKRELMNLTVADYIENIKDSKHPGRNDFHVFGKCISGKEVYIKEKLRTNLKVFCISFHFAEFPLKARPYC